MSHRTQLKRPRRPSLQRFVNESVGAIVLGQGEDGNDITIAHVRRLTFEYLRADNSVVNDNLGAFKVAKQEFEVAITELVNTAKRKQWDAKYLLTNADVASKLAVYAGLLGYLCDLSQKFSAKDIETISNMANQANAIGSVVKKKVEEFSASRSGRQ